MDTTDLKQEFRELLRASGWSQAEAARQLVMTPSALSQIVRKNSTVRPSRVTLRLFQLLLWREKPDLARPIARPEPPPAESWERNIVQALRELPPKTRQTILRRLRAMMSAAKTTGRNAPPSKSSARE